jgi:hypothetical protein
MVLVLLFEMISELHIVPIESVVAHRDWAFSQKLAPPNFSNPFLLDVRVLMEV